MVLKFAPYEELLRCAIVLYQLKGLSAIKTRQAMSLLNCKVKLVISTPPRVYGYNEDSWYGTSLH